MGTCLGPRFLVHWLPLVDNADFVSALVLLLHSFPASFFEARDSLGQSPQTRLEAKFTQDCLGGYG